MNTQITTSNPGNGALARQNDGPPSEPVAGMKYWITKSRGAFERILPKHLTPERFLKVAHACVTKSPRLAECDPKDLIMALIQCSEMGLEPNTPLHHVHLIPFKNYQASQRARRDVFDVQVIVGFEGYLELIYRSGRVKSISCEVVYETDEFDYDLGSKPFIKHRPNLKIRTAKDRGDVIAAYLCAEIDGGGTKVVLMSYADLVEIRDGSQGYQSALKYHKDHPWISNFAEMAKKTVIRRAQKQLPKGIEVSLARAAEIDGRSEAGARKTVDVDFSVLAELPVGLGITSSDAMRDDEGQRGPETVDAGSPTVETPKSSPQAERLKEQAKTKAKPKEAPAAASAPAPAPAAAAPPAPVDPLDCKHRKEGDTFEAHGRRYAVRSSPMGLVPVEQVDARPVAATQDAPPEDDRPDFE